MGRGVDDLAAFAAAEICRHAWHSFGWERWQPVWVTRTHIMPTASATVVAVLLSAGSRHFGRSHLRGQACQPAAAGLHQQTVRTSSIRRPWSTTISSCPSSAAQQSRQASVAALFLFSCHAKVVRCELAPTQGGLRHSPFILGIALF